MTDMSDIILEPDDIITIGDQHYLITFPHPYLAKLTPIKETTNGNVQLFLNE